MGRYGRITGEIKESMTSFLKIDFVHQRREFNKEAHKLARSPIHDSVGRHVWFCNPPEYVLFELLLFINELFSTSQKKLGWAQ